MKKFSSKAKATIFIISVIVISLSIVIGNVLIRNNRITNELTAIAKSYGLKDIKISIGGKIPDYDFYEVTVDCSNLESLSYSQMYSLADKMHADDAYVSKYTSNGNSYEIFPSTKSIYKNGSQIHEDYWNSESYKSANENKSYATSNSNGNVVTDDAELGTCWALAKDVVKSNLKSPSSAKFPFSYASDGVSITKSGNTYTVKAWVDADNSFGANIRSNFTVTMEKSGFGKNAKFTSKSCVID